MRKATIADAREFYARLMGAAVMTPNPRLERAFESVPREAFLPPGPWRIFSIWGRKYVETPTADPVHLYQNVLVALNAVKGINSGEPQLHAAWIAAADPRPGEAVCQIGAGTGYYSAILSFMAAPGGSVVAYEIDEDLARAAEAFLRPFEGVCVVHGDATAEAIPTSDIVYVNAGVVAPPEQWLGALRRGGRMIFPWQPEESIGLAVLATKAGNGIAARICGPARFIPCVGASDRAGCSRVPTLLEARSIRSIWPISQRQPDNTAVAVYPDVWFSSQPLERA